jgi:signal transduction histidine kinase
MAQEGQLKLQEERLRISRDLHDNIGAELSYISSLIDQKTYGLADEKLKMEFEQLSNSSRSAMSQLRETIGIHQRSPSS